MYRHKNKKEMRFFIILVIQLLSWSVFSQEGNTNAPVSNTPLKNKNVIESPVEENRGPNEKESESLKKSSLQENVSVQQSQKEQSIIKFEQVSTQSTYMRSQRTPSVAQQKQMDESVKELEKADVKSFEYNFFKYVSGNYNTEWFSFLKEAEKIRPNNADVQTQMAAYHLITANEKNALEYIEKLVKSARLSAEPIVYANDLLKSAPQNGVLITHGFDDTYAVNYLQLKNGIRKDVQLISLDYFQSETYRKMLLDKGFKLPGSKVIDVHFLNEFCKLNESKSISVSMTLPKEYLQPMKAQLYVVGLTFQFHSTEFNNYYMNDYLWQKELDKKLVNNAQSVKAKDLSANYLPMLLFLRTSYSRTNEAEQLKEIDKSLDKVAVQCNKYQQVQKLKKSY